MPQCIVARLSPLSCEIGEIRRSHRHPYDEIQFIREGRGVWKVSGKTFEGRPGDIFVIKAGEIHSFTAVGDSPLIQFDVHLSSRFIQENV